MKRIFLCLLLIFPLCACSHGEVSESLPTQFQATVTTSYLGESFTGDVSSMPSGEFSVVMKSPSALDGLTVHINADGCRVTRNGIELNYPTDQLGEICPFVTLYEAVEASRHIVPTVRKNESDSVLEYDDGETKYKFTVDRETEQITKIQANKIVYEMR